MSGGEKSRTVEDQIEPCLLGADKGSEPCETDSGTVNPNYNEESCDQQKQANAQLQPKVVNLVNSKDDQILVPEVVQTVIPEDFEKTED